MHSGVPIPLFTKHDSGVPIPLFTLGDSGVGSQYPGLGRNLHQVHRPYPSLHPEPPQVELSVRHTSNGGWAQGKNRLPHWQRGTGTTPFSKWVWTIFYLLETFMLHLIQWILHYCDILHHCLNNIWTNAEVCHKKNKNWVIDLQFVSITWLCRKQIKDCSKSIILLKDVVVVWCYMILRLALY